MKHKKIVIFSLLFIFIFSSGVFVYALTSHNQANFNHTISFESVYVDIDFDVTYKRLNGHGKESGVINYHDGIPLIFDNDDIFEIMFEENGEIISRKYIGYTVSVIFNLGVNNDAEDIRYTFTNLNLPSNTDIYFGLYEAYDFQVSMYTFTDSVLTTVPYFLHSMFYDGQEASEVIPALKFVILKEIIADETFDGLNVGFTIKASKEA